MTWKIRWYVIITITIAYGVSLIGGLIGFWVTRDLHFLAFILPTALMPFIKYLIPMDKKQYDIKMATIAAKAEELKDAKGRIKKLEMEVTKLHKRSVSDEQVS